jgi:hypothetical protein
MVVSWNLLSLCHSEECSKQDFRSSIVARLDVSVDLAALKRSAAKVNELQGACVSGNENIFRLEVAMNEIDIPTRHQSLESLSEIVPGKFKRKSSVSFGNNVVQGLVKALEYDA